MKRRAVITLLVACLWLAGCLGPAAPRLSPGDAAPVIKIGLIAPFEGLGRPLGYGVLPEVRAAIAAANADGRLGPYRVALVALNDDLNPDAAAAQAAALAQDPEVVAVIGPFTAETAGAARPVLAAASLPVLLAAPVDGTAGARSLCPAPAEIQVALTEASLADTPSTGDTSAAQVFFPGGAEAAADALLVRRAEGWDGVLIGGPDMLQPWFVGRAAESGEGTRAVACVLPGEAPRGASPEAALARDGAEIILDAIARVVAQGAQPSRAAVGAALATAEIAPALAWYEVHGGAWERR